MPLESTDLQAGREWYSGYPLRCRKGSGSQPVLDLALKGPPARVQQGAVLSIDVAWVSCKEGHAPCWTRERKGDQSRLTVDVKGDCLESRFERARHQEGWSDMESCALAVISAACLGRQWYFARADTVSGATGRMSFGKGAAELVFA